MKHLLYYKDSVLKKFPLDKNEIIIGRGEECDLQIDEIYASRKHLKIVSKDNSIEIKDLNSTNGTTVKYTKIKSAIINTGESFSIGEIEFILRHGKLGDLKVSKELEPVLNQISMSKKNINEDTKKKGNIYSYILKKIIQNGFTNDNMSNIYIYIAEILSNIDNLGSFFIYSRNESMVENYLLTVKKEHGIIKMLKKIIESEIDYFNAEISVKKWMELGYALYSFPIKNGSKKTVLFYFPISQKKETKKTESFLKSLSESISLLYKLIPENNNYITPCILTDHSDTIIAENKEIKELIKNTKKIAKSNINILIQGESGTGKELFSRLIHNRSKRRKGNYVAINCAAIPDNLLESEFFGYEKGAFTGAYKKTKGKLELASGGTLVLDEIGDMPINLQVKLLRVLQENEFYPLGSLKPVKVDLRIVSITNKDIGKLLKSGKFRDDLYYRIVHRIIYIPPLRERKEDITKLINYFTKTFCLEEQKSINGYSVQAYEILVKYKWKGNIRQLENEIRSIINLVDDGDVIGEELISSNIKDNSLFNIDKTQKIQIQPLDVEKIEKDTVIKALNNNNWNKTHAAQELGMTYRGFHKKMKRLNI